MFKIRRVFSVLCFSIIMLVVLSACSPAGAKYESVMTEALYISDINSYDESLEGKYIIIAGVPEVFEGAVDDDMGARFDYAVVKREGFAMLYTENGDGKKYDWVEMKYTENQPYGTRTLYGTANIGAYKFADIILEDLFTGGKNVITDGIAESVGWEKFISSKKAGNYLISEPLKSKMFECSEANKGIKIISYSARNNANECTVFGMLKDGYIVPTDEYDMVVKKGIMSKEELIDMFCH